MKQERRVVLVPIVGGMNHIYVCVGKGNYSKERHMIVNFLVVAHSRFLLLPLEEAAVSCDTITHLQPARQIVLYLGTESFQTWPA